MTTRGQRRVAFASVALALGLLLLLAWFLRLALVQNLAVILLERAGIAPVELRLDEISLSRAVASEVVVGSGEQTLFARTLTLEYSLASLAKGELDALRLRGIELSAEVDADGVSLAALDPWLSERESGDDYSSAPLDLPAAVVEIDDLHLHTETPIGLLRIEASLRASSCGAGGPAVHGELAVTGAGEALAAEASLRVEPSGDTALEISLRAEGSDWLHAIGVERAQFGPAELEVSVRGALAELCGSAAAAALPDPAAETPHGRLRAQLSVQTALAADLALERPSLEIEGELKVADGVLDLALTKCATLRVDSAVYARSIEIAEPHEVCIEGSDEPVLRFEFGAPSPQPARFAFAIAPGPLAIASDGSDLARGVHPRIAVRAAIGAPNTSASLDTAGGRVALPSLGVELQDIVARVQRSFAESDEPLLLRLATRSVRSTAAQPSFHPLQGDVEVRWSEEAMHFDGGLQDAAGKFALSLSGRHRLPEGRGSARIHLPFVELSRSGLQPAGLLPILGDWIDEATGRLSGTATLRWAASELDGELDISLEEVALTSDYANVSGLSGAIHFDGLFPLRTATTQTLAFGRLETGIDLVDGTATFEVDPDGRITIPGVAGSWAGGQIRAVGGLDLERDEQRLNLGVTEIDLASLLSLFTEAPELSATGTLGGSIPVVIQDGAVAIDRALLVGSKGGVIRYRPDQPPASPPGAERQWEIALRALRDFHYEELRLRVDGKIDDELTAVMELRGSNPEVEDGRPIELNVNLSGAVGELVRASLLGSRVPDRIRERLLERSRSGPGGGPQKD